MARKRGALSTKEEQYIVDHINSQDIHTIAVALNRTDKPVEKYCSEHNLTYSSMSEEKFDDTILLAKLKERPYWKEVCLQFSERELEYFAITWVRMMKQFKEDILYSEEMQVKQWITLEIMCNKVMRDRKANEGQVDKLQILVDKEYAVPEEARDTSTIVALEAELSMMRNSSGSYTIEHAKLLDKIEKIQKDLKAARSDRVKKVEDSRSSWAGLISQLEDNGIRKKIGEDIEIGRMSMQAAVARLSEYHTFADGQVDQPFLTPDTVKD